MKSSAFGGISGGVCLFIAAATLAVPPPAFAHRLDELLQATQVAIELDHIRIDLSITPGIAIASALVSGIDLDHNGTIDSDEASRYASSVVHYLRIRLDGSTLQPRLSGHDFPAISAMAEGVGTIRLRATAAAPLHSPGDHHLSIENSFPPQNVVFLGNALRPQSDRISIVSQRRDTWQRSLEISYRVSASGVDPQTSWWR